MQDDKAGTPPVPSDANQNPEPSPVAPLANTPPPASPEARPDSPDDLGDDEEKDKGKGLRKRLLERIPARWRTVLEIAAVLAILFFGYRFGAGPLIYAARQMPAHVVVMGGKPDVLYDLELGWRGLHGKMMGQSRGAIEVFVGMSETQGLLITDIKSGERREVDVKVRPGWTSVVNLDPGRKFQVYEPARIKDEAIAAPAELLKQLAAGQAPEAADAALEALKATAEKARFLEVKEQNFSLGDLPPGTSWPQDVLSEAQQAKRPANPKYILSEGPIDLATAAGPLRLDLARNTAEGTLVLNGAATAKLGDSVQIPLKKGTRVTVTRNGNQRGVNLRSDGVTITDDNIKFSGSWEYRAAKPGDKPWAWTWRYTASTVLKGVRHDLELLSANQAEPTRTHRVTEPPPKPAPAAKNTKPEAAKADPAKAPAVAPKGEAPKATDSAKPAAAPAVAPAAPQAAEALPKTETPAPKPAVPPKPATSDEL